MRIQSVKKGVWVQIYKVILEPDERAPSLPPETAAVPFTMKLKGFLKEDACLNETATIQTITGRTVNGELISVTPSYEIGYGQPQPELLTIGIEARQLLIDRGRKDE